MSVKGVWLLKVFWPLTAVYIFLKAVELSPDEGHSKYMYLGQIHTGAEAVQYFSKGIEVMLTAIDKQVQEVCIKAMLFCNTFVW